jgi:hypothetical protein
MRLLCFFNVYFIFLGRKLCIDISLPVKFLYYYFRPPNAESVHVIANNNVFLRLPSFRFIALPAESSNGETKVDEDAKKINKRIPNRDEPSPDQAQRSGNHCYRLARPARLLSCTVCSASFNLLQST